ncbi:polysaccharide biosynthesis/export family protein [Granulicella tundricola]|nr:polysaccharide biosynthesis/export family protein [Granulicella tundricola]
MHTPLAGLFVAATVLLLCPGQLSAQFSGPAVHVPSTANVIPVPTADPAVLNPNQSDLVINSGDLVQVRIFGSPDFSVPTRVSIDGTLQLPLIGVVTVKGLSVNDAETLIAQKLIAAGMYVNPQVTVQVTEASGQTATVSGEMHAIVPLSGSRRLLDVLAVAGTLPVNASHIITVLRVGADKPIIVDLGTDPSQSAAGNIPIVPRDTIIISRVGVVYVVGAFAKQGAIPLDQNSPLTLMQLTALSGGVGFEGKYDDLRIIRTVGLERKLVKVDIKRVLLGKNPDPVLEANDIVFLPSAPLKAALKSNGIGTAASIASLFIFALQRNN